MISAMISPNVVLGLKTVVALPVGILAFAVNNERFLILAGLALWSITGIAAIMSGHHPWRNISWCLLAVIVVGTAVSAIATRLFFTPRGGM